MPEPPARPPAEPAHIGALDSLRGVAALVVVLHHVWLLGVLQPGSPWLWRLLRYSPARMVLEGRQPVILFFVLSGFVLSLGLLRRPLPYRGFMARRFTRIYPPFAVAILLSAAGYAVLEPGPVRPMGQWLASFWHDGHDLWTVCRHLLLLGDRRDDLDPVDWSLVHELRISAVLPLLLWIGRRHTVGLLVASVALHAATAPFGVDAGTGHACVAFSSCKPFWGASMSGSLLVSAYFVPFFAMGVAGAVHRARLVAALSRLSRPAYALLVALSLAMLCGAFVSNDLLYGGGAFLLLALALPERGCSRLLRQPALRWLGRVSYSLYLTHLPVFLMAIHGFGVVSPLGSVLLVPLALAVAALFYHAVERPAQRWGQRMTRAAPRPVRQPPADRASARA